MLPPFRRIVKAFIGLCPHLNTVSKLSDSEDMSFILKFFNGNDLFLVVNGLVTAIGLVVLVALPADGNAQDEREGCNGGDWVQRSDDGHALEHRHYQEVDVGVSDCEL